MSAIGTVFVLCKNRRVLWSWANETDSQADDVAKGWSGVQVRRHRHPPTKLCQLSR